MCEFINIDIFKFEWEKIKSKLEKIDKIPKLNNNGSEFDNIDINELGILYTTRTNFCRGCETEYYSFFVTWRELNYDMEYFEKKYSDEIEKYKNEKETHLKLKLKSKDYDV